MAVAMSTRRTARAHSRVSAAGLVAVNESTQNLLSSNTAFDYEEAQNTLVGIGANAGLGIYSIV